MLRQETNNSQKWNVIAQTQVELHWNEQKDLVGCRITASNNPKVSVTFAQCVPPVVAQSALGLHRASGIVNVLKLDWSSPGFDRVLLRWSCFHYSIHLHAVGSTKMGQCLYSIRGHSYTCCLYVVVPYLIFQSLRCEDWFSFILLSATSCKKLHCSKWMLVLNSCLISEQAIHKPLQISWC